MDHSLRERVKKRNQAGHFLNNQHQLKPKNTIYREQHVKEQRTPKSLRTGSTERNVPKKGVGKVWLDLKQGAQNHSGKT
jgi:hypothetical protein